MFFSPKNFKNAPLTTLVGLMLLLAATLTVLTGKATWQEVVVIYPIGVGLLASKDPKQKKEQ